MLDVSRSVKRGPRERPEIVGNESITYVLCGNGKPDTPRVRPLDWSHILNHVKCTLMVFIAHLTTLLAALKTGAQMLRTRDSATCAVECYGLPANLLHVTKGCRALARIFHEHL